MKHPQFGFEMKTYWDTFGPTPYQMGEQKHRVYMLDLLRDKGVKTLLDVGCGTAPIYELIENTGETEGEELVMNYRWDFLYKGTDYSLAMVEICKREFPVGNFEVQDARKLTEPDNSWDCVLLMHSLDHLDDYQAAIREAARVAKKYVCIILWRGFVNEGTNLNNKNMYGKKEGEEPWQDTHLQEYSKQVLEDEFKKNNLIIEHTAEGETINSESSKYNFLYLLKK